MAINLTEKFTEHVDEMFTTESKKALVTNRDYNWTGAHTIKVHKVNTVGMNDYDRLGTGENSSRYGALGSVENTLEEFTLRKDRSFLNVNSSSVFSTDPSAPYLDEFSPVPKRS